MTHSFANTSRRWLLLLTAIGLSILLVPIAAAQEDPEPPQQEPLPADAVLEVEPAQLHLEVGEKAQLTATLSAGGEAITDRTIMFFSRSRRSVGVTAAGQVTAHGPGEFTIIALVPKDPAARARRAEAMLRVEIPVTIPNPPVESVEIVGLPDNLYAGTSFPLQVKVVDTSGVVREDVPLRFSSSQSNVAEADSFGHLVLKSPGSTQLTARAEDKTTRVRLRVKDNPVERLELSASQQSAQTGDVVTFSVQGLDKSGNTVPDLPIHFSVTGQVASGIIAPGASAEIGADGKFVANRSGIYSVVASSGPNTTTRRIKVDPRRVRKQVKFVGQGKVRDRHTSDLWVWEGKDGRDYAITGTWGAEGHAYIWDVTNPENITLIDTVRVDARTVNDVKISEDGSLAVISREGASNRKNGLVILDVSEPQVGVRIVSRYDDQLRGGVHNVFVHDNHVYAVNNGRRFDIINIEDPSEPYRVGRFELDTPGHSIHDVWVVDGVAFTSNWADGRLRHRRRRRRQGRSAQQPCRSRLLQVPQRLEPRGLSLSQRVDR